MTKRKSKSRRNNDYDYGYGYFTPSRPIKTSDGIQSQSKRGAFAANWWAKRWLAVLESYGIGSRLQRGRSYARAGQVLTIDIQIGQVTATVQGSRPKPYKVSMKVNTLADREWATVIDAISTQAIYAAQLLDGTMPQDIEAVFEAAGAPLFPANAQDIETDCSCPDFANPCKHIAAVYYLLGEQFDRDPFLIFTLRGRTQTQIMEELRSRRAAAAGTATDDDASLDAAGSALALDADLAHFWGGNALDWAAPQIAAPEGNAAVLRRLGAPPGNLAKPLADLYQAMTEYVQQIVFSSPDEPDS